MTLLVIEASGRVWQKMSGDLLSMELNKSIYEAQGYTCLLAESFPERVNFLTAEGLIWKDLDAADKLSRIKAERNSLLAVCDWTQLTDVALSTEEKQQWAVYRQALRDFPETCDPENPIWPPPPS